MFAHLKSDQPLEIGKEKATEEVIESGNPISRLNLEDRNLLAENELSGVVAASLGDRLPKGSGDNAEGPAGDLNDGCCLGVLSPMPMTFGNLKMVDEKDRPKSAKSRKKKKKDSLFFC